MAEKYKGEYVINVNADIYEAHKAIQAYVDGTFNDLEEINRRLGGTEEHIIVEKIRWESDGTKKVETEIKTILSEVEKLKTSLNQAFKVEPGSLSSLRGTVNELKQARDATVKFDQATGQLNPKWVELNNKVKETNVSIAKVSGNIWDFAKAKLPIVGEVLSLGNVFNQFGAIAQTVTLTVQQFMAAFEPIIQRQKQVEGFRLALGAFIEDSAQISNAFNQAKATSLEFGLSLTQVEKAYKRLTPTILASGGTMQDTDAAIEALGARTVQLGLNSEQSSRYVEAFAQVMGKGKLQSEELNQQFSELDGALRSQLATWLATNKGIYDLGDAMKNGEVSATDFREAFVAISQGAVNQLSGDMTLLIDRVKTLGEEGGVTVQQLENIKGTLDTMTMESLAQSTSGFGEAMQAVGIHWSKFWASSSQGLPTLKALFQGTLTVLGSIVETLLHVTGIIFKLLAYVTEGILWLLSKFPGVESGFKAIEIISQKMAEGWRILADLINPVSVELQKVGQDQTKVAQDATLLKAAYDANKISLDEYIQGIVKLQEANDKVVEQTKEKFDTEAKKLKEIQEAMNERYKEEQDRIKELIEKENEKKEAVKAQYDELKAKAKEAHDEKITQLKDELQKVKDKYAAELEAINALTPAQKEQERLRQQKLLDILASNEATYEEKVNAQAQLDTMAQQAKAQEIKKKQKEEEKKINKEIADENKRYKEEEKKLNEAQKEALDSIASAVKDLKEQLKESQDNQKEANKRIDEAVKLNKNLGLTLDQINGKIDAQVTKVEEAKTSYEKAKEQASLLADELKRAADNAAKIKIPAGAPNRFAGGSVSGGSKYTVNELGQEGFLSRSGVLSAINAPSWGTWTAPGSGTVIPADVYASIRAAQASRSASAGPGIAVRADGSAQVAALLRGFSGGDNIQNNVTVQAVNTTQAASDMLVSLTKIRRRRYS